MSPNNKPSVLADAFDADGLFGVAEHAELVVHGVGDALDAWRGFVEGKGDAVQKGCFAHAGVAGNEEDGSQLARGAVDEVGLEIDVGLLDGGDIPKMQFFNLHGQGYCRHWTYGAARPPPL